MRAIFFTFSPIYARFSAFLGAFDHKKSVDTLRHRPNLLLIIRYYYLSILLTPCQQRNVPSYRPNVRHHP